MKIFNIAFIIFFLGNNHLYANDNFNDWLKLFSIRASSEGISDKTITEVLKKAKYLPDVIKYDRYQPEFYEDTETYINKRVTNKRIQLGILLYKNNKELIDKVETQFSVEKELLLALMGIETNFGNFLGKMDIISSLATLSFDKRRSKFFSNELLTVLKLVDNGLVDHKILYGSWAGAFGNFQFMPTTIKKYAIDFDQNTVIELKSMNDSFASAANYINKIGWKKNKPCFKKIELNNKIPMKYLNTSAKNIKYKKKLNFYKNYIKNFNKLDINEQFKVAIVTPDKDIVENANYSSPAYLIFDNYELILKWNRSLRFALAVCTLKNNFKNEL